MTLFTSSVIIVIRISLILIKRLLITNFRFFIDSMVNLFILMVVRKN